MVPPTVHPTRSVSSRSKMLDDSTQLPIVPTALPLEGAAPEPTILRRRHWWWAIPLAVIGIGTPVATLAANGIVVDRYGHTPGLASPVENRLTFPSLPAGVAVDASPGEILFVTVGGPHLNALQDFFTQWDQDVQVLKGSDLFGRATPGQEHQIGLQMMKDAKDIAEYVALTKLGYGGELKPGDIVVDQLLCLNGHLANEPQCDSVAPAGKYLERGSTITAVDGVDTPTTEELAPVMAKHHPGDVLTVRYLAPNDKTPHEAQITTMALADKPERPLVGFKPWDTSSVVLPFVADIDTNRIGGPSAGLAFTLTLIDALSPGSLTGGPKVAVTGTISEDGTVGAIGGLHQKVVAVMQAGAAYFIVPFAQGEDGYDGLAEARRVAGGHLEIIPVKTLDEALAVLVAHGGTPVPASPTGAATTG